MERPGTDPLGGVRGIIGGVESVRVARIKALAPRYLALAVALLLMGLGVRSLVAPPKPPHFSVPATADAPTLDFAQQFARVYLTYDANRPQIRGRELSRFVPVGMDKDVGMFVSSGRQRVLWTQVASDQPAVGGGRVITVAAGITTQVPPVYLAVTVQHPPGEAVSLIGFPSFVGAPLVDRQANPPSYDEVSDAAIAEVVTRVLRNYLAGAAANLKADLTVQASVTLPTIAMRMESVDEMVWVGGVGSRAVLATVTANDTAGIDYTLTYEVGLAYRERPYVDFVGVIPTAS